MKNNNYLMEAAMLGCLICLGLTCVDVNVTINVTDKPIITSSETVKNVDIKPAH